MEERKFKIYFQQGKSDLLSTVIVDNEENNEQKQNDFIKEKIS